MRFGLDQMNKMNHAPHMIQVKYALLPAFSTISPFGRAPLNKRFPKFMVGIGRIGVRILKMRNSFIKECNALDEYEGGR